ncbi:hypothetical protein QVD17_39304 [Tagetes erecta]|uniref:Membrane-associated 30 kDa protein, chloroplastic n=1 Tax=Tagetes erecta TaxID=13708 RepID=A0AAD8JS15_TARER|nr:hypothetical protein QVD17_39304 [Tagetes erecta]
MRAAMMYQSGAHRGSMKKALSAFTHSTSAYHVSPKKTKSQYNQSISTTSTNANHQTNFISSFLCIYNLSLQFVSCKKGKRIVFCDQTMAIRAPVAGLSMPSTTSVSSSSSSSSSSRIGFCRFATTKTLFLGSGVGALKVRGIRLARPNTTRCNSIRSNLFDRFTRVVKSYANALISTFEDPEKILEQAVTEMNDDLVKMRQATAQVLASQKRLENKYKSAEQASEDWYKRAQLALSKGDEDLAREALKRRKSYADNAASLKTQLEQQKGVVENLVNNTRLLESKIQEAKSKKDTLKARAQSAKTATKVSEMLGNVNTSSALSAFEKMEEKVMTMESQAEALNQLTTDDLEGKFAMLESSSVDDDLASLKKELSGSTKKGDLPPGRSATTSKAAYPFPDVEIENELNELRQRTRDL